MKRDWIDASAAQINSLLRERRVLLFREAKGEHEVGTIIDLDDGSAVCIHERIVEDGNYTEYMIAAPLSDDERAGYMRWAQEREW